ncbi:MAG: Thioredoxin [Haloplasmataceae bacterium]|jgi:thiol-disulfide isomerase/thioredoxin|nr:Thioredoxin [Haloplasmataceae bacterium]
MMRNYKKWIVVLIVVLGIGFLLFYKPAAKERVLRNDYEYLMYVSHTDCSACQAIAEQVNSYKALAEADETLMPFYKIDLKYVEYTDAEDDFGVTSTPTLLYIKDGRVYKRAEGKDDILVLLEKHYGE